MQQEIDVHVFLAAMTYLPGGFSCLSSSGCDGRLGSDGASCCTSSNICALGEGDCDSDSECDGSLVCGVDNCLPVFGHSPSSFDCCKNP